MTTVGRRTGHVGIGMGLGKRNVFIIATTAGYAILASLWILLSDRMLALLAGERASLSTIASFKGLGFVAVTALALALLLLRVTRPAASDNASIPASKNARS